MYPDDGEDWQRKEVDFSVYAQAVTKIKWSQTDKVASDLHVIY